MFNSVGASTIGIQSIIPVGENVSGDGNVNMQTFTTDANADETFMWLTADDAGVEDGDGWYDEDMATKSTKEFAPGEGFMFCAGNGAAKVEFSAL